MTKDEQLRNAFNKYRYASPLNDQTIKPVLEAMQEYASIVAKQECIKILKWLSEHQQDFSCEDILDNEALEDYYNQIITDLQSKQ